MTQRSLSTAEVARIVGMRESRVREWVRFGLCRPRRGSRGYTYSFRDLVVLRAARALEQDGVPAQRIRRALAVLARDLPREGSLAGLRLFADGGRVGVADGRGRWHAETGQTLLDFDVSELERDVASLERPARDPGGGDAASAAFASGVALEETEPAAALRAYAEAVALDPDHVDAWVNLGRLEHEAGDARSAERRYARALELAPNDPVIHFNLALVLEDVRGLAPAIAHYERALELDPSFADAHFNLAGLCERLGRKADAVRHYHAYKKLTQG